MLALSACFTVGPDFKKPEHKTDSAFVNKGIELNTAKLSEKDLVQWWKLFGDDCLTELIEQAVKTNFDIETARYRVAQARAILGIEYGGLLPTLNADGSMREQAHPIDSHSNDKYSMGATAAWEIDIFGGIRRGIESAKADYYATATEAIATKVKVSAEVAQAYFTYRAYQIEYRITLENLTAQRKTFDITKQRKQNGFVSQLDVLQAAAEVSATNAQLPEIEKNMRLALNALEILVGLQTGSLKEKLAVEKPLPKFESFVPAGVPAELLRRRPDVLAAEYRIHAATANIGVAKAELYPKFTVIGTISYEAPKIGRLVENKYGSWGVGPSISWNLFQGGQILNNIKLQEAVAKEAKVSWKSTVFNAIKEVEDALISSTKERERIELINTLVNDNQKAFDLSKKLYSAGEIEFLDLLVSQRALLASQQNQVATRVKFVNYIVALYKSLGGGWTPPTEEKYIIIQTNDIIKNTQNES